MDQDNLKSDNLLVFEDNDGTPNNFLQYQKF